MQLVQSRLKEGKETLGE